MKMKLVPPTVWSATALGVCLIASPSAAKAQNFLENPGFEDGTGTFDTTGSGVSTNSATWGRWFGVARWQSVEGETAAVGADLDESCGDQTPDPDPGLFPEGWSEENFAQLNLEFTAPASDCDNTEKLIQAVDGNLAESGDELTVSLRYFDQNPQNRGGTVEVCGLNGPEAVSLFFAGSACGATSSVTTLYSAALPNTLTAASPTTSDGWDTFQGTFTPGADYDALAVVITFGGRHWPFPPGMAIGVDDVFFGIPNDPPVCSDAFASPDRLWPANHALVPIEVLGVTDPDGDDVTITIDSIFQDEPVNGVGDGDTAPDGEGVGTSEAWVRAERSGTGNGRVYTIGFTADDGQGGTCTGEVVVGVPKSQGAKGGPVDDGPLYDSTVVSP